MKEILKKIKKQLVKIGYSSLFNKVFSHKFFIKRKSLHNFFLKKYHDFYKKKIPFSEKYPFTVHDPYLVVGEKSGYEKLYLVGENWLEEKGKKPIALMVGFNDWKFGFTSDYLPQYRTAYTKRFFFFITAFKVLFRLEEKPSIFIVWGYNESFYIRHYSKKHNIPLYRMEDGFVRSSLLGASHATPYSLILDKKGLYYNPQTESDIENILNTYDFSTNEKLLVESEKALKLLIDLKISKYNQPNINKIDTLGIKIKKRVVVLGQVDGDAAIRYGNPQKWSSEELVKLARYENPEADVYYRPHPEVYKGYQRSRFNQKRVEYFATVVSPEEPLLDFLESIDHVYTINSLSGLEALLRGKKVTVVGAAFYAGWGLTDDRLEIERRKRKLSLNELFAGIYLKYPIYLADLNNSYIGIQAACYRINADKYVETYNYSMLHQDKIESIFLIASSDFWPQLFINKNYNMNEIEELKVIDRIRFDKFFHKNNGEIFEIMVIYFIVGALRSDRARDKFIEKIRKYINIINLNIFLLDLLKYYPATYIYKHIKWALEENNEGTVSGKLLEECLNNIQYDKDDEDTNEDKASVTCNIVMNDTLIKEDNIGKKEIFLKESEVKLLYSLLETYKDNYDYENVINTAKKIFLLNNLMNTIVFVRLADISSLKADLNSARSIGRFIQKLNLHGHNRAGIHLEVENFDYDNSDKALKNMIELFILQLALNPDRINRNWARLKKYFISNDFYKIFSSTLNLYNKNDIHKVVSYMELNKPKEALKSIEGIIKNGLDTDKLYIIYAQVLFSLGRHDEAINIIQIAIKKESTHGNYTEYIRILRALGNFDDALIIVEEALNKKIELTYEGHIMPVYFGAQKIEEGFKCFLNTIPKEKLIKAFGIEKYEESNDFSNFKNILLIFNSGPSEEIRFSCMYNQILESIGHSDFKITCDYRLQNILSRSFPKINFIPIKRTRFLGPEYPPSDYNLLPSADLCGEIDNNALAHIENANKIKLVTELFYNFRKNYDDFGDRKKYLITDKNRVKYFKNKLPKDTLLIGLSWRSSLTNAVRNIHYLSVEDLEPLFDIPNVRFVNLQYDECSHELEIIRNNYKNDIIDFSELDQMNDFDGVAALMQSLDLVISPLTAVIELAGSIGTKGLLFSNNGETSWRKIDKKGSDVWYNSVKIVSAGKAGDKKSLVKAIKTEILENHIIKEKNV